MIKSLKSNWLIILIGLGVATCTVNAGYETYQRKVRKELRIKTYVRTTKSLLAKYNAVRFEDVITDFESIPTSVKQTAFSFPQIVFIETQFKDAIISNDTCLVYLNDFFDASNGFVLTYDKCKEIEAFSRKYHRVFAVAKLESYTYTDSSFHYMGSLIHIETDSISR